MKKSIATLAFLIIIAAQGGFPETWRYYFITASAILIVALVLIPRKENSSIQRKKENATFTENSLVIKEKENPNITNA